jgi:hypothetical protein
MRSFRRAASAVGVWIVAAVLMWVTLVLSGEYVTYPTTIS